MKRDFRNAFNALKKLGVSPVITGTLRKYGLFAEWQNPAQLTVWEG